MFCRENGWTGSVHGFHITWYSVPLEIKRLRAFFIVVKYFFKGLGQHFLKNLVWAGKAVTKHPCFFWQVKLAFLELHTVPPVQLVHKLANVVRLHCKSFFLQS